MSSYSTRRTLPIALLVLAALAVRADDPVAWDPALATAEVRGRCVFVGEPPPPRTIAVDDARCAELSGGSLPDESLVVGSEGALANVVVRVKGGLERWRFPGPSGAEKLDQQGCRFRPHVLAFQAGTPVVVHNSDACSHNVHGLPRRNSEFNFGQARAGSEEMIVLTVPEMGVRVKCDIHPWMTAFLCAVEHPFFAVSAADGAFRLPKLPPGEYVLEAWHERLGTRETTVRVEADGVAEARFEFAPK